jgi:hypothetical protein
LLRGAGFPVAHLQTQVQVRLDAALVDELRRACADRDALAAEVRVWRAYDDSTAPRFPTRTEVEAQMEATDAAGALVRAGGGA